MTDRDALYRSIIENPMDNTVRRVFADFIREQGKDDRADFIELQIQIAELVELGVHKERSCNVTGPCNECNREGEAFRLRKQAKAKLPANMGDWFPDLRRYSVGDIMFWKKDPVGYGLGVVGNSSVSFVLDRGFVSTVVTGTSFWFAKQPNDLSLYIPKERGTVFNTHGARLVVTHPIDRVTVKNLNPRGSPVPGGEIYPFAFRPIDVSRPVWDLLYPNRFANLQAAHDKLSWVYLTLARREAGLPNLPWGSSNDLKD